MALSYCNSAQCFCLLNPLLQQRSELRDRAYLHIKLNPIYSTRRLSIRGNHHEVSISMKKSTKALLASAFVFPGVGHYLLNARVRAWAFGTVAAVLCGILFYQIYVVTHAVMTIVLEERIAIDFLSLRQMILDEYMNHTNSALLVYGLIATWLVGLLDTWLIIKKTDI